jgi:hypothetical protein
MTNKRQPLQTTFEAGVASPLMFGRSDLPGYGKSAKDMLNMFADTRGPAVSRPGFEYKSDVADASDIYGRLFTFRESAIKSYIVAVTPTSVWITDQGGLIASDNKVLNGNFEDDGTNWTEDTSTYGSVTYPNTLCRINSGGSGDDGGADAFSTIEQNITGLTAINDHVIKVTTIPPQTVSGGITGGVTVRVGTAQGLSDIVLVEEDTADDVEVSFVPGVTSIWVMVEVLGIEYEEGNPMDPTDVWHTNIRDVDVVSVIDITAAAPTGFVSFATAWTEAQIHDLQAEMAPDTQEMYFVHREVAPQKLSLDISTDIWSFGAFTITWATTDPWTTPADWPGAIAFFQNRLYLAGTVGEPVSIWGSKPGSADYDQFTDTPTAVADDPVKFVLARNADIQWMQGSKILYIGCDNSEHIITSDGPAVINSDVDTDQFSAYGSARIKTNWVSSSIAFTSLDARRLRLLNFDANTQQMSSGDLTFASEHLTAAGITEMQHRMYPINTVFATLADGTFLSCSLETERGIVAWSPHAIKDSSIISLTVAHEGGVSALYALVYFNGKLRLCRMGASKIFMDNYISRGYVTATNTVDGLEHLNGKTVQVIGDGNLYPDALVTAGSLTTVGPAASQFTVGCKSDRRLETMLVDDIRGGGSSRSSKKGWNRIFARIYDSGLPKINGIRPPDRTPTTPMNQREPNLSKDVIAQNVGWDYEGTILIEQDLPLDLIITGIFGELSEENL